MKESQWIESLGISRKKKELGEKLLNDLKKGCFERFDAKDSYRLRVPAILIKTKGKGKREYLDEVIVGVADVGAIGYYWGDIYFYEPSRGYGQPRRFKPSSDRILKIVEKEKK